MANIKLAVSGINCINCVNKITNTLNKLDGTNNVYINFAERTLELTLEQNKLSTADIIKTIKSIGYSAKIITSGNKNVIDGG